MAAAVDSAEAEALKAKIDEQGNKVRTIKSAGAAKQAVDQEVQALLQLKQDYKALTGVDLTPAGGGSKKDKKAAKKAEQPADTKKQPAADKGGKKTPQNQKPAQTAASPASPQPAAVAAQAPAAAQEVDMAAILRSITQGAKQADGLFKDLSGRIMVLKNAKAAALVKAEEKRLKRENDNLRLQVEALKERLVSAESRNGVKQVSLPKAASAGAQKAPAAKPAAKPAPSPAKMAASQPAAAEQSKAKEGKKKEKKTEAKGSASTPTKTDDAVDVSRVDMRVGKIIDVKLHPDADTLYVEQVDLGEEKPRTIVSGLVKNVPIEQMRDRLAIFTCNLKPAKMRGIFSEGMIMCGSSPDVVEVIELPQGAKIGDLIYVEGFEGTPDAMMNPKKKIFEQVQPDFRIDNNGVATYRGKPWKVRGVEGLCTVPTMRETGIK